MPFHKILYFSHLMKKESEEMEKEAESDKTNLFEYLKTKEATQPEEGLILKEIQDTSNEPPEEELFVE